MDTVATAMAQMRVQRIRGAVAGPGSHNQQNPGRVLNQAWAGSRPKPAPYFPPPLEGALSALLGSTGENADESGTAQHPAEAQTRILQQTRLPWGQVRVSTQV